MTQEKRGGCLWKAVGILTALVLGFLVVAWFMGRDSVGEAESPGNSAERGALMLDCERAVRAQLDFPDEARFTSAFSAGMNGEFQEVSGRPVWVSTVKAKNTFGVQSSYGFTCLRGSDGAVVATLSD